jgi:hypothetical protein
MAQKSLPKNSKYWLRGTQLCGRKVLWNVGTQVSDCIIVSTTVSGVDSPILGIFG